MFLNPKPDRDRDSWTGTLGYSNQERTKAFGPYRDFLWPQERTRTVDPWSWVEKLIYLSKAFNLIFTNPWINILAKNPVFWWFCCLKDSLCVKSGFLFHRKVILKIVSIKYRTIIKSIIKTSFVKKAFTSFYFSKFLISLIPQSVRHTVSYSLYVAVLDFVSRNRVSSQRFNENSQILVNHQRSCQ